MRSYKQFGMYTKRIPSELFYDHHNKKIETALKSSKIKVVCDPVHDWNIIAYIVFSEKEKIIHYVYVKEGHQLRGLAKELVKATGLDPQETFITHLSDKIRLTASRYGFIYYAHLF
jgi:hypothetical protein